MRGDLGVQADQMAAFFAAVGKRTKPDLDVVTRRDILERMHLCSSEPEAVTYAEVDAGGVPACGVSRRAATTIPS